MKLSADWYKSHTFWFALLGIAAATLGWSEQRVSEGQALIVAVFSLLGWGVRNTLAKSSERRLEGIGEMTHLLRSLHSQGQRPVQLNFTASQKEAVGVDPAVGGSVTLGERSSQNDLATEDTHSEQECGSGGDEYTEVLHRCQDLLVVGFNLGTEAKSLLRAKQDGRDEGNWGACYSFIQKVNSWHLACVEAGLVDPEPGDLEDGETAAGDEERTALLGRDEVIPGMMKARAGEGQMPVVVTSPLPSETFRSDLDRDESDN
jgi:hypothetical protein